MSNVFELWRHNGELLPFGARRDSWAATTHVLVEEIEIRRWPYGTAFGFVYLNGERQSPLNPAGVLSPSSRPDISCAGSYQWSFVPLPGCPIGVPIPPKPTKQKIKKVRIFRSGDLIGFGKYKTVTVDDVIRSNPSWIKWALLNIQHFAIDPPLWDFVNSTDPEMKDGGNARTLNHVRVTSARP